MPKDFKESEILSEVFSFTMVGTAEYTSEYFTVVLAAAWKF